MNIYLEEGQALEKELEDKMMKAADFLLKKENVDSDRAEISLTFVTKEEIKELNSMYRGIDNDTDVLSFPQFEDMSMLPEEGEICLGDVVICPEKARLQAEEYGHSQMREMVYLFVHSILHLLGYDHIEADEKAVMRQKEEEAMKEIDLGR